MVRAGRVEGALVLALKLPHRARQPVLDEVEEVDELPAGGGGGRAKPCRGRISQPPAPNPQTHPPTWLKTSALQPGSSACARHSSSSNASIFDDDRKPPPTRAAGRRARMDLDLLLLLGEAVGWADDAAPLLLLCRSTVSGARHDGHVGAGPPPPPPPLPAAAAGELDGVVRACFLGFLPAADGGLSTTRASLQSSAAASVVASRSIDNAQPPMPSRYSRTQRRQNVCRQPVTTASSTASRQMPHTPPLPPSASTAPSSSDAAAAAAAAAAATDAWPYCTR